jgi:type 1 glutamine amidotransferase
MRRALFVWGGWDGHTPKESAALFAGWLAGQGYEVEISDSLDSFADPEKLKKLHLIVPVWTLGQLSEQQEQALCGAVAAGVGLAGWHGAMCDSFRSNTEYQWMTGGQFVAHPGGLQPAYNIRIVDHQHPITEDLPDFAIRDSEQYYMHVDPANHVLAVTPFDGGVNMPAVWTRVWGRGRVAYASFGHTYKDFDAGEARQIVQRSLLWASRQEPGVARRSDTN